MPRRTRVAHLPICLMSALPLAAAVSCGTFDSGLGEEESGETGDEGGQLPGHRVTCCFSGYFADASFDYNAQHFGCQNTVLECIDENADISPEGLEAFCNQKCTPAWEVSTKSRPAWHWFQLVNQVWVPGGVPPAGTFFNSCSALAANSGLESHIEPGHENQCYPLAVVPYAELVVEEPTFEASFTSSPAGPPGIDITITGTTVTPTYDLVMHYSLQECTGGGIDGGSCQLVLSYFDLTTGRISVGSYIAGGISLALNEPAVAEVNFSPCGQTSCVGRFEFSEDEGNPLSLNLFWTQRGRSQTVDSVGLNLSNGPGGLGGVDSLIGGLAVDPASGGGTLYLIGSGADRLSGDWATVDFNLDGEIQPL